MIAPALLLAAATFAADPASYPQATTIELPPAETLRLDLSDEWIALCPDPDSYLLLDAEGQEQPFAARSSDEGARWRREDLRWEPVRADRGWAWLVQGPSTGEPARALRLDKLPRGSVVEIWVKPQDDPGTGTRHVLWNLPDSGAGTKLELELDGDDALGPWLVRAVWSEGTGWMRAGRDLGFQAAVAHPWTVEAMELELEFRGPVTSGATTSDWLLDLPSPGLPLRGLSLDVGDPVFSRGVTLLDASLTGEPRVMERGHIERLSFGPARVESTDLSIHRSGGLELLLRTDDGRSAPLDLDGATVLVQGQALVLPNVAGGEYTLLGCGPRGASYDLERLDDRLAELPAERIEAPSPQPHGAWEASSVGRGLLEPGPVLSIDGYRWERRVAGDPGLVKVTLDDHGLIHTRPGQPDLRFVDDEDRQLPYLLRHDPVGRLQHHTAFERVEDGAETKLTVTMVAAGLPARDLVLRSDRTLFERDVTVWDGAPGSGRVVARSSWRGADEGESRLVLPLDVRIGSTLTVVIDNGDNPAIDVTAIELLTRSSSAWLALPAQGGARMVYGNSGASAPSYDLALLREQILSQPVAGASVGQPTELSAAPPEPPKKALLLIAVAVLAALLLGMIVRLMKTPEDE